MVGKLRTKAKGDRGETVRGKGVKKSGRGKEAGGKGRPGWMGEWIGRRG